MNCKINTNEDEIYYKRGSTQITEESALTLKKLEKRRKLTTSSERLVICVVGLPGRGKSFIARKLMTFLTWRGMACQIFNVGKYRRRVQAMELQNLADKKTDSSASCRVMESASKRQTVGACDADFFDNNNALARKLRSRAASVTLQEMLIWLDDDSEESFPSSLSGIKAKSMRHRVAIFDATNSTAARRKWVLEECTSPTKREGKKTGVIFVESICDDAELLEENYCFKVKNSPDFEGMTLEESLEDLSKRVDQYTEQYETINDDTQSYIKIFNLSSKLLVNHIYGRMAKVVVPSLMSWNIGSRPIYLCRAGETNLNNNEAVLDGSRRSSLVQRRVLLGGTGLLFREALEKFIKKEGFEFAARRENVLKEAFTPTNTCTGTSVSGLAPSDSTLSSDSSHHFGCHVMTSTMPRAVETATWDSLPFEIDELPNLNPLDKGDFSGMELEEIREKDPAWYKMLEDDTFLTRFPGGECYKDLVQRLETCIIDMEQQLNMVCVVSHLSVLQVLIAYFRGVPIEKCTSIQVPMHTVIKFTPVTGGAWTESQHKIGPNDSKVGHLRSDSLGVESPIWGDHCSRNSFL